KSSTRQLRAIRLASAESRQLGTCPSNSRTRSGGRGLVLPEHGTQWRAAGAGAHSGPPPRGHRPGTETGARGQGEGEKGRRGDRETGRPIPRAPSDLPLSESPLLPVSPSRSAL